MLLGLNEQKFKSVLAPGHSHLLSDPLRGVPVPGNGHAAAATD